MRGQNISTSTLIQSTRIHCVGLQHLPRQKVGAENITYDKEKYLQLLLSAAETVLGYFGFDSTLYRNGQNKNNKRKWWAEIEEERIKDIQTESNSAL